MTERVYVALDLETTGLNSTQDTIIEIGAVRIEHGEISARFNTLVNPRRKIPLRVQQITGIRNEDVAGAPGLAEVLPELLAFVRPDVRAIVAHNADFDLGFLRAAGVNFNRPALDTFDLAAMLLPRMASYSLGELCRALQIELTDAHRALDDAQATGELFVLLATMIDTLPAPTLAALVTAAGDSNWPPLLLYQDALARRSATPEAAQHRAPGAPLPSVAETLIKDGGPPPQPVPAALTERIFAVDGPLASQLGPQFEVRAGQLAMMRLVRDAFNQGDHLMVEAGTGIGKSLAYLLPAAYWSIQNQRRVVIATNTIALQDQLLEKDIPQVQALLAREGSGELYAALLKGRQNYLCTRRLNAWYRGRNLSPLELIVLAKVLIWLPTTTTGDVGELFLPSSAERSIWREICSDGATCHPGMCDRGGDRDFYLEARRRADHAHLLIINHALLTADLGNDHRSLPPYSHLIVDEAHHLEDVTTEQMTYRVDWQETGTRLARLTLEGNFLPHLLVVGLQHRDAALQEIASALSASAARARRALTRFADQLRTFAGNHSDVRSDVGYVQRLALDGRMRTQPMWSQLEIEWEHAGQHLRATCDHADRLVTHLTARQWQQQPPEALLLADLAGQAQELRALLEMLNTMVLQPHGAHDLVTWLEYSSDNNQSNTDVRLAAAPLYVGDVISQRLLPNLRTIVLTGATLRSGADFRFIRERLGLWDVNATALPSPFDYRRSTLIYLPTDLPLPNHPQYQQAVDQAIIEAAGAAGGRTLVLFTSYAHLRTTADSIRAPLDRLGITVLQHGTSSRNRLLREYRDAERAVLLGTRSFWEGIDLPGDQLSVLFIVRLPFAVPSDPLVAARSAEFENSFGDYTLPDAILRFRQGFGRLIRRASDRGVVVMLDSRLWQKQYGQAFLEALPDCTMRRSQLDNLATEVDLWLHQPEPAA